MQIILILLLAFILANLPIIGIYFRGVDTMIHESGHALMALVTQGHVYSVSLFMDTSGETFTASTSWVGTLLTSLSGYVFSSIAAYAFLYLLKKGRHHLVLYILMAFVTVNLILWVRNVYGIIWLLSFFAILVYLLRSKSERIVRYAILLIAGIVFMESVTSAFTILKLSFFAPQAAGDASNLGQVTLIPTPLWGIAFFAQALFFAYLGLKLWFKQSQIFPRK